MRSVYSSGTNRWSRRPSAANVMSRGSDSESFGRPTKSIIFSRRSSMFSSNTYLAHSSAFFSRKAGFLVVHQNFLIGNQDSSIEIAPVSPFASAERKLLPMPYVVPSIHRRVQTVPAWSPQITSFQYLKVEESSSCIEGPSFYQSFTCGPHERAPIQAHAMQSLFLKT